MTSFCCRSCGSTRAHTVLDLGLQPLANNLLRPEDLGAEEPRFPLVMAVCNDCWLLQITETVPPVKLFTEYLYFSSVSDALLNHARNAAQRYRQDYQLDSKSLVVEVASNDGYLLQNFVETSIPCLGVEPARNIAEVARERGIPTWNQFFNTSTALEIVAQKGAADLILGNNVFAHAPDTNDFVAGLATLVKPHGRIVLEFPYACDLVEHLEFDTIYHEHVFYFTLTALVPLFRRHDLEIFHAERIPIHGGSLRIFVGKSGAHSVTNAVTQLLAEERTKGVDTPNYYENFSRKVLALKAELLKLIGDLRSQGHRLCAYGASAKGSTLLNFYGLGREGVDCLDFVVDRSAAKQGRLTPGTHLPILPVEELMTRKPRHALLLTWNFSEEILRQQQAWRDAGGKFILPIPEVKIV